MPGMEGSIETVLEIAAVGMALAGIAMFLLSRMPAARVASLGLLVLAAAVAWIAWSEAWMPLVR